MVRKIIILTFILSMALVAADRHYPAKNSFDAWLHQVNRVPGIPFREPLEYTFFEFSSSLGSYGYSGLNMFSYDEDAMGFDSTEISLQSFEESFVNRTYFDMDLSIIRVNLLAMLYEQNVVDYMNGLGIRRSMHILPLGLNDAWQNETLGLAVYNFRPMITEIYISQALYYQPFETLFMRFEHSYGIGQGYTYQTLGSDRLLPLSGSSSRYTFSVQYALDNTSPGSNFVISAHAFLNTGYYVVDDSENISPIEYLDMHGLGLGISLYIQLGGRRSGGDDALRLIRRRDYLAAREMMNSYALQHPGSARRDLAMRYIAYCDSMAYFEYYKLGNQALSEFKLEEALKLYDRAFASRNKTIRQKVILRRTAISQLFMLNALQELQKGDYIKAEAILNSGAQLSPYTAEDMKKIQAYVNVYKARSLISSGLYERADSYLQLAGQQNPVLYEQITDYRDLLSKAHLRDLRSAIEDEDVKSAAYILERLKALDRGLAKSLKDIDDAVRKGLEDLNKPAEQPELYALYSKMKEDDIKKATVFDEEKILTAKVGMTLVEVLDAFGTPHSRKKLEKSGRNYELLTYEYSDRTLELYFLDYYLSHIDVIYK